MDYEGQEANQLAIYKQSRVDETALRRNWNCAVSALRQQLHSFQRLPRKIPDGGKSGTWTKNNQISILLPLPLICKWRKRASRLFSQFLQSASWNFYSELVDTAWIGVPLSIGISSYYPPVHYLLTSSSSSSFFGIVVTWTISMGFKEISSGWIWKCKWENWIHEVTKHNVILLDKFVLK
mgnify:CR=1 FL=1